MKEALFPIVETKENRLIALDGHESALFRVLPPVLEQYTLRESDHFFDGISRSLNQLREEEYIRFYSLNDSCYMQMSSDSHFELVGCELLPEESGLEVFFGSPELYSNLSVFDDYINFNGLYWRVLSILEFPENTIGPFPFPLELDYVLNI